MSKKQKSKCIEPVPIMEIPNFEDQKFIWCSKCKNVHPVDLWEKNYYICPSHNCNGEKGLPWEILKCYHETYPNIPKLGKF
ncbi:MAG: hypothetical protein PHY51_05615, partial [Candidatus Gracilibacteria bacterium]|nr:hypothetical protein [Candidatus Gracilibacteria bacterium]